MGHIDGTALDSLRTALRGPVIAPGDAEYDESRTLYNAMIDRRPAALAQCVDVADVRTTLAFAQDEGLDLAVRGGGHSGPGLCLIEDGLTLDLSPMRWVRVDPEARTAQVGGGAQLGDLDHATHTFGLGVPAGIMSTTGVGGLTLGGGHGYLTRAHGLTIDSLTGADVVLADGTFVTASETEHPDLFWALRGGGGNFGVVTSFTYRLHPVDTVGVGVTVWPVERTAEVLRWYRDFLPAAPDDLYGFFALLAVPPAASVPGGDPRTEDVRRRLVLHGRPGVRPHGGDPLRGQRPRRTGLPLHQPHALPRPPDHVRRPDPEGTPVVLAR